MGGHADVILLVRRGWRAVGGARIGEVLVFAHQGRRCHFGNHQAGIQAWIRRQERRQVKGQRRIDHQGDASLGDRTDLRHRERDLIGGKADRFGMEVPARDDRAVLDKDKRIVGDCIGFDFKRASRGMEQVHGCPRDLRLAADAIGILHPSVADAMAFADLGSLHQAALRFGHCKLSGMSAQGVDRRVQGCG